MVLDVPGHSPNHQPPAQTSLCSVSQLFYSGRPHTRAVTRPLAPPRHLPHPAHAVPGEPTELIVGLFLYSSQVPHTKKKYGRPGACGGPKVPQERAGEWGQGGSGIRQDQKAVGDRNVGEILERGWASTGNGVGGACTHPPSQNPHHTRSLRCQSPLVSRLNYHHIPLG